MKSPVKYPYAMASVFIWIGFLCAISFMEAWLKFRAPGVTLPIGLGIGRLVFGALNKVELLLAFAVLANIVLAGSKLLNWSYAAYFLAFALVIVQSIWLLPQLDVRAEQHIQGLPVSDSNLHFYYIGTEVVKLFSLLTFGYILLVDQTTYTFQKSKHIRYKFVK